MVFAKGRFHCRHGVVPLSPWCLLKGGSTVAVVFAKGGSTVTVVIAKGGSTVAMVTAKGGSTVPFTPRLQKYCMADFLYWNASGPLVWLIALSSELW